MEPKYQVKYKCDANEHISITANERINITANEHSVYGFIYV